MRYCTEIAGLKGISSLKTLNGYLENGINDHIPSRGLTHYVLEFATDYDIKNATISGTCDRLKKQIEKATAHKLKRVCSSVKKIT